MEGYISNTDNQIEDIKSAQIIIQSCGVNLQQLSLNYHYTDSTKEIIQNIHTLLDTIENYQTHLSKPAKEAHHILIEAKENGTNDELMEVVSLYSAAYTLDLS